MDGSNDRQRKDRLIQTRVPQNLESTLKDEARKRRLSVSHLIRNVLEDTFHLVDNVVTEVDRVVADSVGMAQTLRRDAQRLAATARGRTSHRRDSELSGAPDEGEDEYTNEGEGEHEGENHDGSGHDPAEQLADEPTEVVPADDDLAEAMLAIEAALSEPPPAGDEPGENVGSLLPGPIPASLLAGAGRPALAGSLAPAPLPGASRLADVVGLQEAVVYRASTCATCGAALRRGVRAYLGLREPPSSAAPVWLCMDCTESLGDEADG
jgi:hypothetical protein